MPLKDPVKNREYHAAYRASNAKKLAAYRAANVDKCRARRGLPPATRPCPDVCECCGKPPAKHRLSLDHCHLSHTFRGWLCNGCNRGIGLLGDDIPGLIKALQYLTRVAK